MKQKRVLVAAIRPTAASREPAEPRESWLQWLAPIVFGVGLGLDMLLSPLVLFMANGGYGDCFDTACEAERRYWASIGGQTVA